MKQMISTPLYATSLTPGVGGKIPELVQNPNSRLPWHQYAQKYNNSAVCCIDTEQNNVSSFKEQNLNPRR